MTSGISPRLLCCLRQYLLQYAAVDSRLAGPQASVVSGVLVVPSHCRSARTRAVCHQVLLDVGSGDSNSDPHACIASSLSTEPFPRPTSRLHSPPTTHIFKE